MFIKRITERDNNILDFVQQKYRTLPAFGNFNLSDSAIDQMLQHCDVNVVYDNQDQIKAIMVTFYGRNFLDHNIKTLSLEAIASDSPKATVMLLSLFIDMGKQYADHLTISKGVSTNLKSSTLLKLGFKPLETVYKLEV
jgi:hypothetical protein